MEITFSEFINAENSTKIERLINALEQEKDKEYEELLQNLSLFIG